MVSINLEGVYSVNQEDKIDQLVVPATEKSFKSQRDLAQYIRVSRKIDVRAAVTGIASGHETVPFEQYESMKIHRSHERDKLARTSIP